MQPYNEARHRANRLNAQKSTGPKTRAGKKNSAMNALTHGLGSQSMAGVQGDRSAVRATLDGWLAFYKPATPAERALVEKACAASLQKRRCIVEPHHHLRRTTPGDDSVGALLGSGAPAADSRSVAALRLYRRYERFHTTALHRALRDLRHSRALRLREGSSATAAGTADRPADTGDDATRYGYY
jgi:hypothetical protein